mmetsp:Transcript_17291/g.1542  ORF Transcript_17291/g.1542 Transcript_17291/m.1542 type:complete len:92 (-) Transcript_17291:152-427(-)
MGRLYLEYLEGNNIYTCNTCSIHLTSYNELISKAFRGKNGKAYLFNNVVNVCCGAKEDRVLLSGLHTVCDLFCKGCHTVLGWKYEHASEET